MSAYVSSKSLAIEFFHFFTPREKPKKKKHKIEVKITRRDL